MADKPIDQLKLIKDVTDETLIPVWDPTSPDIALTMSGMQLKYLATSGSIYTSKDHNITDTTAQEATLYRRSCVLLPLIKIPDTDGVRLNSVGVKTAASGMVKFAVYTLTDRGDETGTLTCVDILGEALSSDGFAGLENLNYYSEAQNLYVMAFARSAIISCWHLAGLNLSGAPYFDDADFYGNDVGERIECGLGLWEEPFSACVRADSDSVVKTTISDFAAETNQRLDALEQGGGPGEGKLPPTKVDLTAFESSGVIVETYADGSRITYTMEFDAEGNPTKITDSDGNVTTLTW